jgi:hypothetical protein
MVNENTIRKHVTAAVRKADLNTVSAKQIRRTVETQLSLPQDYLADSKWRNVVKGVIEETMAAIERGEPEEQGVEEESEEENFARMCGYER